MEYVNNIYPYTYIRITKFYIRIMSTPAAYYKSIPGLSNNIVFLYDFV